MLDSQLSPEILRSAMVPATAFEQDQAHIQINTDHIEIHATDWARIAYVDISLQQAAFNSFQANVFERNLNANRLVEYFDIIESQQQMTFTIVLTSQQEHFRSDTLTVNSSTTKSDCPTINNRRDIEHVAKITLPGDALQSAIILAEKIATHMTLGIDPERTLFYGNADGDLDSVRLEHSPTEVIKMPASKISARYPLDYLSSIQDCLPDEKVVEFAFSENGSLTIHYPIADGYGDVTYRIKESVI